MSIPSVDRSRLGSLKELGEGGEGRVFAAAACPSDVYKEFRPEVAHELDSSALERTIRLLSRFSDAELRFVRQRTTWPHTVVVDGGRLSGFLMSRLPHDIYCTHGVKAYPATVECKWDLLSYRERNRAKDNIRSDASLVDPGHVLDVLLELALLVQVLHRHDIVLGDISGRNLLWTVGAPARIVIIDCDGFRASGTSAVTRSKQTPDWIDPVHGADTCIESDRFKLGLAIYRGYFSAELGMPGANIPGDIPVDQTAEHLHALACRAISTLRPTADEWITVLESAKRAERLKGRPVVDLPQVPKPTRQIGQLAVKRPTLDLS